MISSFKMALRSIGSNKMRAALTMLGIIIGVMALVVLVSLVNGATNTVTDEVSSLGSNYVDAYVWRQEVGSSLTINDLRKWAQENEYVEAVAPVNTGDAKGKAGSSSDSISLYGTMPAYADINGLTIEYGRFLKNTDVDNSSRVCVLSKQAAEQIVGYADCVGEDFSIDGMRYTIVGVLGERALPSIEIEPKGGFYDYKNKYQAGCTVETTPANIPPQLEQRLREASLTAHRALGLYSYSRSDFIYREQEDRLVYLENNTLPGMTPTSLLPQEAAAVGIGYPELCEIVVRYALER